jgi:Beta-ketoacyl synthase, N-terminal domain
MLYIHHTTCISPQPGLLADAFAGPVNGVYRAIEPDYAGIPAGVLRRMSKAVRLGVGAVLPLLQQGEPDGILTGTGNGGMEESVKFLRQIIEYREGLLTPGHFVQSIPNAIASQIGLLRNLRGYNSTYVHRGLGFEHALIDAAMLIRENTASRYLVGGVDECSGYHYQIELADGWYKRWVRPELSLYDYDSPGSIAGEGAALFLVSGNPAHALAAVRGIVTLHSTDKQVVDSRLRSFLAQYLPAGKSLGLFLSGENGDNRALPFYNACEKVLDPTVPVARFKHLCGEYPTASAFALWLTLQLTPTLPGHMIKKAGNTAGWQYMLIYNNHKLTQHSFILLERFR